MYLIFAIEIEIEMNSGKTSPNWILRHSSRTFKNRCVIHDQLSCHSLLDMTNWRSEYAEHQDVRAKPKILSFMNHEYVSSKELPASHECNHNKTS